MDPYNQEDSIIVTKNLEKNIYKRDSPYLQAFIRELAKQEEEGEKAEIEKRHVRLEEEERIEDETQQQADEEEEEEGKNDQQPKPKKRRRMDVCNIDHKECSDVTYKEDEEENEHRCRYVVDNNPSQYMDLRIRAFGNTYRTTVPYGISIKMLRLEYVVEIIEDVGYHDNYRLSAQNGDILLNSYCLTESCDLYLTMKSTETKTTEQEDLQLTPRSAASINVIRNLTTTMRTEQQDLQLSPRSAASINLIRNLTTGTTTNQDIRSRYDNAYTDNIILSSH